MLNGLIAARPRVAMRACRCHSADRIRSASHRVPLPALMHSPGILHYAGTGLGGQDLRMRPRLAPGYQEIVTWKIDNEVKHGRMC